MITLLGGKYNGKFVDRERLTPGSTLAIIDGSGHEVYVMRDDGIAEIEDPYSRWDDAVHHAELR